MQLPKDLLEVVGEEKMLWCDKPKLQPFFLRRLPYLTCFSFIILILANYLLDHANNPLALDLLIPVDICLILVIATFPILSWRNTYYAITENKMIRREGIMANYSILKLEYVLQVSMKVSVLDKIFNTGTNVVRAAGIKPFVLENVERPMEVRGIIEEQTHNQKTVTSH